MPGLGIEDLEPLFTNHPLDDLRQRLAQSFRERGLELATEIVTLAPDSAERTLAVRHLQQAIMYTVAAIAIHGEN